jgi:hypothetical protein
VKRRTIIRNIVGGVLISLGCSTEKEAHSKEIKPEIVTIDGWVLLSTDR